MSLLNRLKKLELKIAPSQQEAVCRIGCGYGCSVKSDDEYCEHEQQRLDKWTKEHDGMEPDLTIRIIGVSRNNKDKAG